MRAKAGTTRHPKENPDSNAISSTQRFNNLPGILDTRNTLSGPPSTLALEVDDSLDRFEFGEDEEEECVTEKG